MTNRSRDELQQLTMALAGTAEVLGHEIKPTAIAMMVGDLEQHSTESILKALSRLRANYAGRLTLKAIIDELEVETERLSANEAWALALGAQDESATVVWTDEIAAAWNVALPILEEGDKVGARMAFIPAYERLVREAREAGRPAKWVASLGWDQQQREQALTAAVQQGRLPPSVPVALLPPPEVKEVDEAGRERIHGLLRQLSEDLKASSQRRQIERERQLEQERLEFEQRRAATVKMTENN